MANKKSKVNKCFILTYLEYNEIISALRYLSCYKFALIKHDKDRYNDYELDSNNYIIHDIGEEKKHHYHICAWFNSYHTIQFIANRFDTTPENMEILNEFVAIPYLIHYFEDDTKYKYNFNEIISYGINVKDYFINKNLLEFKKDSKQLKIFNFCLTNDIDLYCDLINGLQFYNYYDLLEWVLIHYSDTMNIIKASTSIKRQNDKLPF